MEPLFDKDLKDITCSDKIGWTKLTEIATANLRSGKTITDGITFRRFDTDKLAIDNDIIDVAAFETAIGALDADAEKAKEAFIYLRKQRNEKLSTTDWTQSRDITLSNDNDWKTYRQALRDLPANTSDPTNPTWPTEPS